MNSVHAKLDTIPPKCEWEPDVMIVKEVQNGSPIKRFRANTEEEDKEHPEIFIVKEHDQVFYMIKGASPETEEEWTAHNLRVRDVLRRHGTHKINCDFWRIRGPLSREERMDRVLEFWRAGDIVPRNPFLHKSLQDRKAIRASSNDGDANRYIPTDLEGYSPTEEGDKVLEDINKLET